VKVERIGPCVRLVFAVEQTLYCGSETVVERTIIAKLVIPANLVGGASGWLSRPGMAAGAGNRTVVLLIGLHRGPGGAEPRSRIQDVTCPMQRSALVFHARGYPRG
jgi:hypothetical protein